MKKFLTFIVLWVATGATPWAQGVIVHPASARFSYPAADFAAIVSFHLDLFSCVTLTPAGVCTTIPTPNVPGVDIPVAKIVSPAGQLMSDGGPMRVIDFTAAPVAAALAALPLNQAYEATLTATGNPSNGTSPRSAFSAPFFPLAVPPATPGSFQLAP